MSSCHTICFECRSVRIQLLLRLYFGPIQRFINYAWQKSQEYYVYGFKEPFRYNHKFITLSEKRLLIDIAAIRENYRTDDLSNVAHVSSSYNIANTFFKAKTDKTMLLSFMETGKLSHSISQWILPQDCS